MRRPAEIEYIQLVAILRVLDCSQDMVAGTLHLGKLTVGQIEEWLRSAELEDICRILDDKALASTLVRELPACEELDSDVLVRAGRIGRDDVLRHYNREVPGRANLRIRTPCVDVFTDAAAWSRCATVEVVVLEVEAQGCWAWVDILPSGPTLPLHWAGTPYTSEETTSARIIIRPEKPARLDVAVALPPPTWTASTLPDATVIGEVPMFLHGSGGRRWDGSGCWLAQPLALYNPHPGQEAYLHPGEYRIRIRVGCENGDGDSQEFVLWSPSSWEGLALAP